MNYQQEYKRLRSKGWTTKNAARVAKINVAFDRAEQKGLVRLRVLPDEEQFDDSYVDTWESASDAEKAETRAEIWRRIEREGVWGIVAEIHVVCKHCGADRWAISDSVWCFIGDDWKDSGYDSDCKHMTLVAAKLWKE